jgi:hypothetical protein
VTDTTSHAEQLERFAQHLDALDLVVRPLEGAELPGLRIVLEDETAELVCLFMPLEDSDDLPDLDVMQIVVSHGDDAGKRRAEVEAALARVNEACPLGYFGVRTDGSLYYRLDWPCPRGGVPGIVEFADAFKLIAFADLALRPVLTDVIAGKSLKTALQHLD